ncbi:MAG: glycine oxidase ThiO [Acidobacteriota bacterium]|nr:MAG: glycine oxidase ThiO [Acidobacteriota bacterium]
MGQGGIPEHAALVVVGGGLIGLATAFELLRREQEVLVLERSDVGAGASTVAAGMLVPASEAMTAEPELIRFGLDSLSRYPQFIADVRRVSGRDPHYRDDGTLWVALNRDHLAELERLHAIQQEYGLGSSWLTAREVLEREPRLTGRVVAGLLVESEHHVDPRELTDALAMAVTRRGGGLITGADVRSIMPDRDGWLVEGKTGESSFTLRAEQVVGAAGAWMSASIDSPLKDLGMRPIKGQTVRLSGEQLIRDIVFTPDVYIVPQRGGKLIVGGTMEEQGFEDAPTAGAVLDLLRRAWETLPGVDDLRVDELAVSFRPAVSDHMPVIGSTGHEGLFVAGGHFRKGILLAPATAHYLAELIVSGQSPTQIAPFAVDRQQPFVADVAPEKTR